MVPVFCFIYHSNRIVGIADNTFSPGIESQLFTAKDIFAGAFTVCLKVPGRTDVCPSDIFTLAKFAEGLCHSGSQRFEYVREIRPVRNAHSMFRIHIQASRSADNEQPGICTGENVAQMFQ